MIASRICKKRYSKNPLDGIGGLHASGRWNLAGHAIVYTSSSAALAAMEMRVHVEETTAPHDLVLIQFDIPESLPREILILKNLPRNWNVNPAPKSTMRVGTDWLKANKTPLLLVPSAVIPMEQNILINPRHPEVSKIQIMQIRAFSLDSRLFTARRAGRQTG